METLADMNLRSLKMMIDRGYSSGNFFSTQKSGDTLSIINIDAKFTTGNDEGLRQEMIKYIPHYYPLDVGEKRSLNAITTFVTDPADERLDQNPRFVTCVHVIQPEKGSNSTALPDIALAIAKIFDVNQVFGQSNPPVKVNNLIIVSAGKLSPPSKQLLVKQKSSIRNVQFFLEDEVYKPDHVMLPKIEKLKGKDLKDVRAMNLHPRQFPKMFEGDMGIKYFGYPYGTYLRITRLNVGLNTFVEQTVSYTCVCKGDPPVPKIPKNS